MYHSDASLSSHVGQELRARAYERPFDNRLVGDHKRQQLATKELIVVAERIEALAKGLRVNVNYLYGRFSHAVRG